LRRFEYFAPTDILEALQLIENFGDRAKLLAGGTDLIVQMKNNEINPSYLIDLKKIHELTGIHSTSSEGIKLGPLTTISEVESSKAIVENIPILSQAATTIGSIQIRNRATTGGNVCRAAPSADLVPALLVLDAQLKIRSLGTERIVQLEDFFIGPGKTTLKYNEILTEIKIPTPPSSSAGVYLKYGPRQTMDLAVVGVAVCIVLDPTDYICRIVKIALGSVAPTPLRARKAEKILVGGKLTQAMIEEAAKIASEETSPITDVYGLDWYKRDIVSVLVKRAIMEVLSRIRDHKNEA
jgi:carbon-monoxide dehydrogenase medium subunit